jgi:superkiller protein 3
LADDDPWRQQFRDAALRENAAGLERIAGRPSAVEQPPTSVVLLSYALIRQKSFAAAERLLRQAQERHPDDFWLNFTLANLLRQKKKPAASAEAVGYYQAALACRPGTVVVYNNLGVALRNQRKLPEAVAVYHKAIELKPDYASAYSGLGMALRDQRKLPEAVRACRKAIELNPDDAVAYNVLGRALRDQRNLPEAVAAYRKAIELKPDYAAAYNNLGFTLCNQHQLPEAVAAFHKAIQLQPDYVRAHVNLGLTLQQQGQLVDGLASLKRGHELGPPQRPGWTPQAAEAVRRAERLVQLDAKLPKVLSMET